MPVSGVGGSGGVFWPESLGASSNPELRDIAKQLREKNSSQITADDLKNWANIVGKYAAGNQDLKEVADGLNALARLREKAYPSTDQIITALKVGYISILERFSN